MPLCCQKQLDLWKAWRPLCCLRRQLRLARRRCCPRTYAAKQARQNQCGVHHLTISSPPRPQPTHSLQPCSTTRLPTVPVPPQRHAPVSAQQRRSWTRRCGPQRRGWRHALALHQRRGRVLLSSSPALRWTAGCGASEEDPSGTMRFRPTPLSSALPDLVGARMLLGGSLHRRRARHHQRRNHHRALMMLHIGMGACARRLRMWSQKIRSCLGHRGQG